MTGNVTRSGARFWFGNLILLIIAACPGRIALADEEAKPPDLRLIGAEVTAAAIDELQERDWGTVSLLNARFDGEIVERLRHAGAIRELHLSGSGLSGQIPRLDHVPGLTGLLLDVPLTGRDLEALGRLERLERLRLPKDFIVNVSGAGELARLTNLKSLSLYHVDIDDASFAELKTLVRLEELDLSHTRVTDRGLATIEHMPLLKKLELYRHPDWHIKQQLTDACAASISRLARLEQLSLSGQITDEGLKLIAGLPELKALSILATEITPDGLAALEDSAVENLTLTPYQVGGAPTSGIDHLKKCRRLKSVTVIGDGSQFEAIEALMTELPDVAWGFIDP